MPLIRISQYNKNSLPRELNNKLYDLARTESAQPFCVSESSQYLIAFSNDQLIGFVELSFESPVAYLKNIVVDKNYSRQKIAIKLLRACFLKAGKFGCSRVQLKCKERHINLFENAGFLVVETCEDGKSYIMENACPEYYLDLINNYAKSDSKSIELNRILVANQDSETYNFTNEHQYTQLHNRVISQAKKQVWMLCDSITNPTLDNEYTSQCLFRLIKQNPNTEIRLLLANDKIGAGYFNPTINLAQRLTSYVEIRAINKSGSPFKETMTIVDSSVCLYRRSISSMTGFANLNNQLMVQRLKHNFEHHWAFSKPSMQLRRLAI